MTVLAVLVTLLASVGSDGQEEFWNAHAEHFMNPPQFDFATDGTAVRYRFAAADDRGAVRGTFEAEKPTAFLSPIWERIPENDFTTVSCTALAEDGREIGKVGERRFFKVAAFKPGKGHRSPRSYAEAAAKVYDYVFSLPSTRRFLETGRPDMSYALNTYPTKMHSALVSAMVRYADLRPERADEALALARKAADYLISISQPQGAPLEFMPPTYEGDGLPGYNDRGENMLIYPASAGNAYLDLNAKTGERKYLEAARRIAETYLKLQGADGTCPLKVRELDGVPVAPNRAFPLGICRFMMRMSGVTGETRYREAADRGFAMVDRGPLRDWNWEGQFEDVKPSERYRNLTVHTPCDTARYVLSRYPGDVRRIAQARRLLDFVEDQFVVWERPCRPDGVGARSLNGRGEPTNAADAHYLDWSVPGVLEQYRCYVPIDSAAAKVMDAWLVLHGATRDPTYMDKARTLGDAIVAMQQPSGRIQTFWRTSPEKEPVESDWINCMLATANALGRLSAAVTPPPVRDAVSPVSAGEVRLLDRPGELFRMSLERRIFSERAKGPVYDEAENAFATHWDDADGHTGWQNEYWGKTMLCYAGAVAATGDRALSEWCVRKARRFIAAYQRENGYLSTYGREDFLRNNPDSPDYEKHWCFNIWGRKYTLWALIELFRATGDVQCLDAAEKMADHLIGQLRRLNVPIAETGAWAGISSMSILRPLVELHRLRPKAQYLELAREIVRATDVAGHPRPTMNVIFDALSDRPVETWFGRPSLLAKAYEMTSYFEGVADYYRLTGEPRMLEAVRAFWGHLAEEEINPMRSVGYFDHFLGSRRHVNGMSELCDVVHWIRLNRELWLLTGETKYLDCIEESFYNAFLAGVSPDGSWGAHVIRSHGTRHLSAPPQTGMRLHQCCPDNMLRAFYDWSASVADMSADGAYELNLYSDADLRLKDAEVSVRGGYPVADRFRVRIRCSHGGKIRFRVPQWTKWIRIDGSETVFSGGRCERDFRPGEQTFEVAFDMAPRILDSKAPDVEDVLRCVTNDMLIAKGGYTENAMTWSADEMRGLVRTTAAAQVLRGPLVLAKGKLAGTSRAETFDFTTVNKKGVRVSLDEAERTAGNAAVWGSWRLTFEGDGERLSVPVGDFWSLSKYNDAENWFSVWF